MRIPAIIKYIPAAVVVLGVFSWANAAEKPQITIDMVSEPSTLDPQLQWNPDSYFVYRNIFDNLVTRSNDGKISPEIATQWKNISDTVISFALRQDVKFHDGTPLTPEDVAFSINRIIDPKFASPQLSQFAKIAKAEVSGNAEVTVTLKSPYPPLLAQLTKLSIVPEHVVRAVGDQAFNAAPVGSGPYKFEKWNRGVSVTLVRNDSYWGAKGPFERAVFRAVPDASTRLADLQAGVADFARALTSDQALQLQSSSTAKAVSALTERMTFIRVNPNKPPFDNLKVRQALAYAIDKEGITQSILNGFDKPVAQMMTPAHLGWSENLNGLPYDPDKAKALIVSTGATPKTTLTLGAFFDRRVAEAVLQELKDVGFDVSINLYDSATFLQLIQKGPVEAPSLAISTNSCACQDADGALTYLFHSGSNWAVVNDGELDKLLDDAGSSFSDVTRLTDYRKINQLISDKVWAVPLYQSAAIYGVAKGLEFRPTANESFFLNRLAWGG